jgi:hypothetical protein
MIICLVYYFLFLNEVNLLLLESVKGGYKEKDDVKFLRKNPEFGSKSETVEHEERSKQPAYQFFLYTHAPM